MTDTDDRPGIPDRSHMWPFSTNSPDRQCTECGITWLDHYCQPNCTPLPPDGPETTAVRIYLLTCGHVQWGLDHGIDDWDRESVVCRGCGTHVGIRHYITEQA